MLSRALTVVVTVAAVMSLACATAAASCVSSTPSNSSFADPAADGDAGLAPEIATVTANVNGSCTYAVDPGIAEGLIEDSAVFEYIDVDGNAATGSQTFRGADVAIGTLGVNGIDPPPRLGVWNASAGTFSFANAATLTAVGNGGFSASIDQLGIAAPATTTIAVASIWSGIYDNYFDFAPNPGLAPFPLGVAFSTAAPPPPPPPPAPAAPAPAPTSAPVAQTPPAPVVATGPKSCKVPALKRLRLSVALRALKHAGCRAGSAEHAYSKKVPRGRVIESLPKGGTTWSDAVDLVVSRGPRPSHRRARRSSVMGVDTRLEVAVREMEAHALGIG